MMTSTKPTLHEIIAELNSLTQKFPHTNQGEERRAWLKQFRALLDQADQLAGRDITPENPPNY
jgi:hypothetical protein